MPRNAHTGVDFPLIDSIQGNNISIIEKFDEYRPRDFFFFLPSQIENMKAYSVANFAQAMTGNTARVQIEENPAIPNAEIRSRFIEQSR